MAAGRIVVPPYFPARDRDFNLLAGALLYVYDNETTAKAAIYTNEGLTVLSSNPVVANSSGQFPAIFAEAGTEASPVLYSVSVTTSTGASPGNPFVFDNYRPSVDWETAASALAEAAAEAAAADAVQTAADAVQTAADLAAIEAIIADAPDAPSVLNKLNLSGDNVGSNAATLRSNIGAVGSVALAASGGSALVGFLQALTTPVARTAQDKLREQPVSPQDSGESTDALRFLDATDSAFGGNGRVFIPAETYQADVEAPTPSSDMRGKPITILGAGSGECFVADALQYGTLIQGVTATTPVWSLEHNAAQQGMGSVDFGMMRLSGTKNAGVPILNVNGFQGTNYIRDVNIQQDGVGDGLHLGNVTTSTVRDMGVLGASWAVLGGSKTGTGVKLTPDQDHALGWLHKITSRGFDLSFLVGADTGDKMLGYTFQSCEVSTCTNGVDVRLQNEATLFESLFVEGTTGFCARTYGDATMFTNPYCVHAFTSGIELRGTAGIVIGGYIGLKPNAATGITIGTEGSGGFIFGTELIWGGGGGGGNCTGVKIEAIANPIVYSMPQYTGSWSGGNKLVDLSTSTEHPGVTGSGVIGIIERKSKAGEPLPSLSRVSLNLRHDGIEVNAASVDGSGYLTLSAASVQYGIFNGTQPAIIRFLSENLPDKTGKIIVTADFGSGGVTFRPSAYLRGISIPLVIASNEDAVIEYQNVYGSLGACYITSITRTGPWTYTVAELLTGNSGSTPWPAQPYPIYASNGRKSGEGPGAGTGCPVYNDGTTWRTYYDNTIVAA